MDQKWGRASNKSLSGCPTSPARPISQLPSRPRLSPAGRPSPGRSQPLRRAGCLLNFATSQMLFLMFVLVIISWPRLTETSLYIIMPAGAPQTKASPSGCPTSPGQPVLAGRPAVARTLTASEACWTLPTSLSNHLKKAAKAECRGCFWGCQRWRLILLRRVVLVIQQPQPLLACLSA